MIKKSHIQETIGMFLIHNCIILNTKNEIYTNIYIIYTYIIYIYTIHKNIYIYIYFGLSVGDNKIVNTKHNNI